MAFFLNKQLTWQTNEKQTKTFRHLSIVGLLLAKGGQTNKIIKAKQRLSKQTVNQIKKTITSHLPMVGLSLAKGEERKERQTSNQTAVCTEALIK